MLRLQSEVMFAVDPAFVATSHLLLELSLCQARLQDDARYPWIVLIPRIAGARELEDLSGADQTLLMAEILAAGRATRALGEVAGRPVEKLNIGALGNVTPQLHIHVVGRRADDPAWPAPVWGHSPSLAYESEALARTLETGRAALQDSKS
ncbi:MAG: HIT domain-containing protein [Phenylobacterium sp.]|uniref:HIT domain-containing protein n=1 Tax=Phenylobacterium sp. TaxID=1871053 RepID=UPI002736F3EF|nr:HIT domain-containing protein [Phenylobacterium sp.]MDP3118016.1 HIT domain-containing protein [Phenylobacterium sp.]